MNVSNKPVGMQIGFGGTMFTLWRVDAPDQSGNQTAYFCGNISKNQDVVRAKYPNLPFTEIKGYEFSYVPYPKDDGTSETFVFGKNQGKTISLFSDQNYILWYWQETQNINAFDRLAELGMFFSGGTWFASEQEKNDAKKRRKIRKIIFADGFHQVTSKSNISIGEQTGINVSLDDDDHIYEFPYGQFIEISNDLFYNTRSYMGIQYGVIKGVRSMKGRDITIEVRGKVVVSISLR